MVDTRFYQNNGPFTLAEVAEICAAELVDASKAGVKVTEIAMLPVAGEGEICFFYDKKMKEAAKEMKATACVTTEDFLPLVPETVAALVAKNPQEAYRQLNMKMYAEPQPQKKIAATAVVAETAKIGAGCFIGEYAVIEDGVEIGNNCRIGHHAVIAHGCKIGNNCRMIVLFTAARSSVMTVSVLSWGRAAIKSCRKSGGLFWEMMLKFVPMPVLTAALLMIRLSVTAAGLIIWFRWRTTAISAAAVCWFPRSALPAAANLMILWFAPVRPGWQIISTSAPELRSELKAASCAIFRPERSSGGRRPYRLNRP